jgi:hypothetical protein
MIGIGYAPSAYDLLHIGHLNLLRRAKERRAKEHCDYLIAGIVAIRRKGVTPVRSQCPLRRRRDPGFDERQGRHLRFESKDRSVPSQIGWQRLRHRGD